MSTATPFDYKGRCAWLKKHKPMNLLTDNFGRFYWYAHPKSYNTFKVYMSRRTVDPDMHESEAMNDDELVFAPVEGTRVALFNYATGNYHGTFEVDRFPFPPRFNQRGFEIYMKLVSGSGKKEKEIIPYEVVEVPPPTAIPIAEIIPVPVPLPWWSALPVPVTMPPIPVPVTMPPIPIAVAPPPPVAAAVPPSPIIPVAAAVPQIPVAAAVPPSPIIPVAAAVPQIPVAEGVAPVAISAVPLPPLVAGPSIPVTEDLVTAPPIESDVVITIKSDPRGVTGNPIPYAILPFDPTVDIQPKLIQMIDVWNPKQLEDARVSKNSMVFVRPLDGIIPETIYAFSEAPVMTNSPFTREELDILWSDIPLATREEMIAFLRERRGGKPMPPGPAPRTPLGAGQAPRPVPQEFVATIQTYTIYHTSKLDRPVIVLVFDPTRSRLYSFMIERQNMLVASAEAHALMQKALDHSLLILAVSKVPMSDFLPYGAKRTINLIDKSGKLVIGITEATIGVFNSHIFDPVKTLLPVEILFIEFYVLHEEEMSSFGPDWVAANTPILTPLEDGTLDIRNLLLIAHFGAENGSTHPYSARLKVIINAGIEGLFIGRTINGLVDLDGRTIWERYSRGPIWIYASSGTFKGFIGQAVAVTAYYDPDRLRA